MPARPPSLSCIPPFQESRFVDSHTDSCTGVGGRVGPGEGVGAKHPRIQGNAMGRYPNTKCKCTCVSFEFLYKVGNFSKSNQGQCVLSIRGSSARLELFLLYGLVSCYLPWMDVLNSLMARTDYDYKSVCAQKRVSRSA